MKMLVESLKRMYKKGTLTKEQISERVSKGSISVDEYEYITGRHTLAVVQNESA